MDDLTLGIIYAVKHGENGLYENLVKFLAGYTAVDDAYYTDAELKRILRSSFVDYLKTADNPSFDVWQFFEAKRRDENFKSVYPQQHAERAKKFHRLDDDSEAILEAFRLTTVRKDGEYVNGFRDFMKSKV